MKGTLLDKDSRDRSAAFVQPGLDDSSLSGTVGIGLEFLHIRDQIDHLKQGIDSHTGLCGNIYTDDIAAPFFRYEVILSELGLDALRICFRTVHLVECHNDRHIGSLGMVDRFHGLRHDAVIRSDDQDCNISNGCAASTDRCKRLVSGSIQESDGFSTMYHLICADMLCDSSDLTGLYAAVADVVQNRGLTMVNVSHDDNDWRPGLHILFRVLSGIIFHNVQPLLNGDMYLTLDFSAEFFGDKRCCIKINEFRNGSHNAKRHEFFDDCCRGDFQTGSQFADRDLIRNLYLELSVSCFFKLEPLKLLRFSLLLLILLLSFALTVHELLAVALHIVLSAAALVLIAIAVLLGRHNIELFVVFAEIDFRCTGIYNALLTLLHDYACRSLLRLVLRPAQLLFSALFYIVFFGWFGVVLFLLLVIRVGLVLILSLILSLLLLRLLLILSLLLDLLLLLRHFYRFLFLRLFRH